MTAQPPEYLPLPEGYRLEDCRIERLLSRGGFSMVYLAHDAAGRTVAVKEYLPAGMARRGPDGASVEAGEDHRTAFNTGMRCFFDEGRILAGIDHPNVVRVRDFYRANGTAYLVMRYEEGETLKDHTRRLLERSEAVPEGFLRHVFVHLLAGLREVHARKLLHLDIKPANIYLRRDGHPVLLDFGAARQGLGPDAGTNPVFTPGFAAPEQQGSGEPLGPWTDIYSVGATLYDCLAGMAPQAADQRLIRDELESAQQRWGKRYTPQLLELIDWCLKLPVDQRPPSVFALQKVLSGEQLDLIDPSWFDRQE
ncbi:MAG: Serine/threonine-protein kinase PrkC [Rhodocyclaceae bacterium]|nr:serine/threonine protein kinase [Zoogloeaceae bacterium]MBV6407350.1 Serine/threonine-protein kinase PrkC [Rhodocyclaceae bacterium]MCK6383811.1 serine/threonine protein kinase [Rhodocyclaceae bacterium]CAG0932323.1 serine/threonine protein kinase, bacterial [Rhodocyclaceae bacterium]